MSNNFLVAVLLTDSPILKMMWDYNVLFQWKCQCIVPMAAMIGNWKTKSLRVNLGTNTNFNIKEDEIQEIKKFTHLGGIVSSEGGTNQDIVARIEKTNFESLKPMRRVFFQLSNKRIQTFTNCYLCHILQIQWQDKVRNDDQWKGEEQQPLHLQSQEKEMALARQYAEKALCQCPLMNTSG